MNISRLILPSLTLAFLAGWGGAVPSATVNWGANDGMTDIIPATSSRYYWYPYSGGLSNETWDKVQLAVATLDNELPTLRWLPGSPTGVYAANEVLVSIGIKNDAVPPECSDTESDPPCVLGFTECVNKTNNTVPGMYDTCRTYKVSLYWSRIVANNAAKYPGVDPLDTLYSVARHELTHAMGFRHGSGGPMADGSLELTECQRDILRGYSSQLELNSWGVFTPESCQ